MRSLLDRSRAALLDQLARLLDAGVAPVAALESLCGANGRARASTLARAMLDAVRAGEPISAGMRRLAPHHVPLHHALALESAERSGHPAACLRRLAAEDLEGARAREEVIRRSLYPILLFHAALFLPLVARSMIGADRGLAGVLLALVVVDLLILATWRALFGAPRTPALARLQLQLPALGSVTVDREYHMWFSTLHELYEAGEPLANAAPEAAGVVENPIFRARIDAALAPLERGEPFAAVVAGLPRLRHELRSLLITAEPAGELGAALAGASRLSGENAQVGRLRLVRGAAGLLYAVAVLYAAYAILSFYGGLFASYGRR